MILKNMRDRSSRVARVVARIPFTINTFDIFLKLT